MKWLQWATFNLKEGYGGVEVHARSLDRELRALKVDASISARREDLPGDWDVIHTHGSAVPLFWGRISPRSSRAVWIHTLHGTTLGRMSACREWFWIGGYFAAFRELFAVVRADVVLAVHEDLWLYRLARRLGKVCAICSNGWDSGVEGVQLAAGMGAALEAQRPFWVFIGRGKDPVKAVPRLKLGFAGVGKKLVAVPGDGFEDHSEVYKTGLLTPAQITSVLAFAQGLVLSSYYEGLPLVVLEALASGVPVVASRVGGLKSLPPLSGLFFVESKDRGAEWAKEFARVLAEAERSLENSDAGVRRAKNRSVLPTWRSVAERALAAAKEAEAK